MIRKIITVVFALLAVAFFARLVQYGYKWLSHAPSQDLNYKALTAWCAVYVVVCAAVSWGVSRLPKEDDGEVETANER